MRIAALFLYYGASFGALKTRLSLLVCVCLSLSLIAVTCGLAARRIEVQSGLVLAVTSVLAARRIEALSHDEVYYS